MKKLFTLLLAMMLSFSAFGLVACGGDGGNEENPGANNPPAEYTVEGTEGLSYAIYGQGDDRYASFTGLNKSCTATEIVIASHYQGVKVTEIGDGMNTLYNFKNVESVKVHKYITVINSSAFYNCTNLKTIDFEEDCEIAKFDNFAFLNCTSLENFNYYGKINMLGDGVFDECDLLPTTSYEGAEYIGVGNNPYLILSKGKGEESVKVHKDCTIINSSAFLDDLNLKSVVFESDENLISICSSAFKQSGLIEITIPSSLKSLSEDAFYGCPSLKTVSFTENSQCTYIGNSVFQNCTALEELKNFDKTKITIAPERMLMDCTSIKYISFPATTKIVKVKFMWGCTSNEKITFPKDSQLQEFEMQIFRNNKKIKSIIVPKTVQKIGYNLLGYCHTTAVIYSEATVNASWHIRWNERGADVYYPVYYYSETYKEDCWHYVNGEPTLWS